MFGKTQRSVLWPFVVVLAELFLLLLIVYPVLFGPSYLTAPSETSVLGAAFVYDPEVGGDVLLGDVEDSGQWVLSHGTWRVDPIGLPSDASAQYPGATFDAGDSQLLEFGGVEWTGNGDTIPVAQPQNQTWAYQGGSWSEVTSARSPPARFAPALTYDAADGYALLFGGACSAAGRFSALPLCGDTWTFSHSVWSPLNLSTAASPSPRMDAAAAYNSALGCVELFGGYGDEGGWIPDLWTFCHGQWTNLTSSVGGIFPTVPAACFGCYPIQSSTALVFDPAQNCSYFFVRSYGGALSVWKLAQDGWSGVALPAAPPGESGPFEATYDGSLGTLLFLTQSSDGGVAVSTWGGASFLPVSEPPPSSVPLAAAVAVSVGVWAGTLLLTMEWVRRRPVVAPEPRDEDAREEAPLANPPSSELSKRLWGALAAGLLWGGLIDLIATYDAYQVQPFPLLWVFASVWVFVAALAFLSWFEDDRPERVRDRVTLVAVLAVFGLLYASAWNLGVSYSPVQVYANSAGNLGLALILIPLFGLAAALIAWAVLRGAVKGTQWSLPYAVTLGLQLALVVSPLVITFWAVG